ncbi:molybdopterin molybdotransferase MoeA [Wansuia hejianensis]|uniref:Molybdopterin molybdenumtransferase n=1 Tax=Wansuia hejianensis TaxID=2763667 RepID=A0A926F2W5_9FIRM|nr:molybdopterin molybdotransferase MoeA [Wansuia hejianensis]
MKFFDVVSIEEAIKLTKDNFRDYRFQLEEVHILKSIDRVVGEDIHSNIDVPEFNRSTVDGYGINIIDSHGATDSIPSILNILGQVKMGEETKYSIKSGDTVYIPTGGMIPKGVDGVVMIENTEKLDQDSLLIYKPISQGENIISQGDDIKKNSLIIREGRKITPEVMGVLAALGMEKVKVYKQPKFYIISTGDEIIDIDEELNLGKVRDINSYGLYGLVKKIGGQVVGKSIIKDHYESLRAEVDKALDISDIVLISGGSSVGTRDYTYKVIDSFNEEGVFVHGLSIKPGKPTIIGKGKDKPIFGLPGHPVSSIIVFKAIIEPFINEKLSINTIKPKINAIIDFNFPSSPGKTTYQMVKLVDKEGVFFASPSFGKSGMISLLSESQGYIILEPKEEGVYKGEEREVYLL